MELAQWQCTELWKHEDSGSDPEFFLDFPSEPPTPVLMGRYLTFHYSQGKLNYWRDSNQNHALSLVYRGHERWLEWDCSAVFLSERN